MINQRSSFLCSERFYLVGKYEGALGVVCRVGCDASNQLEHWSNTWKSTQLIWTYLAANTSTSTTTSTATTTTTGTTTAKKKKKKRMRRIIFIDRSKWDDECNDLSFNCYHYWYRHHHFLDPHSSLSCTWWLQNERLWALVELYPRGHDTQLVRFKQISFFFFAPQRPKMHLEQHPSVNAQEVARWGWTC